MMYLVTAAEGQNQYLKVARGLKKSINDQISLRSEEKRKEYTHVQEKQKKKKKTYGVDKKDYAYMGIDILSSESSPI